METVTYDGMPGPVVLSVSIFLSLFMVGAPTVFNMAPTFGQYTVDTFLDGVDANLEDGVCATIDGDCSLRAALQQAEVDSLAVEISLPSGIYAWNLGQLLIESGDIMISGSGARTTIIDANGASRFLDLTSGVDAFTAKDLEWRNGVDGDDPGGAIETNCDDVLLERVTFRNCQTGVGFGGAIHNRGHIEAYGCLFQDCVAEADDGNNGGGGGGGALGGGGAMSCWTGSSSIFENCTFYGCQALGGDGGDGMAVGNGGQGGQSFSSFGEGGNGGDVGGSGADENAAAGNIGGGGGGGGYSTGWVGGTAGSGGNGVLVGGNGAGGASNGAGGGGGGGAMGAAIFSRAGDHTFRHCTFTANQAIPGSAGSSANGNVASDGIARGGAIGVYNSNIKLDNCILYGNTAMGSPAGDGEDIYLYSGGPILSDVGHNIIGVLGDNVDSEFDAASVGNLIGVDPILLPFGDYGGPTDACMISACQPLSPAIDAGAALGITEDQRGKPRDLMSDIGSTEWTLSDGVFKSCPGCSCSLAHNYSPQVTHDDGSCIILGCIDSSAVNYLISANSPIPCIYNAPGCDWDTSEWEWDCSEFCDADINQDGLVNVPDLLILLGEFAGGCE